MFDITWVAPVVASLLIGLIAFVGSLIYYSYKDKK